jgi:hypothetical protein
MALAQVSIELITIYFHSFEIFNIQIGEMTFCKPDFIIIKSNYFQNVQKGQCFLDDFEGIYVGEMSLKLARLKRFFLVVVFGVIGGINLWGIGALLSLKSIRGKTLSGQLLYQPLE